MPLTFTLIDNIAGTSTTIDEPIGMDKVALHLRRDETYHGFLDAIDDSLGAFQFYGEAYNKIKNAYITYGVDADMNIQILFACPDGGSDQILYRGKLSFDQYKEIRGNTGCYIECNIQNGYDLQTFRNRMNQKVSLDSIRCFDQPNGDLSPYTQLGNNITLLPKTVRFLDYATIDTTGPGSTINKTYQRNSDGTLFWTGTSHVPDGYPSFIDAEDHSTDTNNNEFLLQSTDGDHTVTPFTNIRSSEFGEFPGCVGDVYTKSIDDLDDCNEIFHYTPEIPFDNNNITIDIDISGALFYANQQQNNTDVRVQVGMYKGLTWNDAHSNRHTPYTLGARACKLDEMFLTLTTRAGTSGDPVTLQNNIMDHVTPAEVDYCVFQYKSPVAPGNVYQFYPGEKLYFLFHIMTRSSPADMHLVFFSNDYTYRNTFYVDPNAAIVRHDEWTIPTVLEAEVHSPTNSPQSYIKINFDSKYKATETLSYMVNESLSRSVEMITNDKLRVYSDYFGRAGAHASQPYAPLSTGPAGRTCLTNGLLLRGSSPIQTWYMGTGQFHLSSVTAATHTLYKPDDYDPAKNNIVTMGDGGPSTITIPISTSLGSAFPVGAQILIEQLGGTVTVVAETGVTLSAPGGNYTTSGYGSQILLTKIGEDSWLLANHAPMFASFQEMIEALNCIHAVGFGLESDTFRGGDHDLVRVEPISHFYDDSTILMICDNVDTIETDTSAGEAISVFKTGYTKWEAEEANGLDEFLSKREYRTTLKSLRKTLDKQCKYIASGYAIEVSRRKLGTSTTDWRYDNDTFIICLAENPVTTPDDRTYKTDYISESGGAVSSTATKLTSILFPDDIYNYRISPARNALRWLRHIMNSYANWAAGKLIFMSGDGNYTAQGLLANDPIEVHALNESDTLSLDLLADTSIRPIYKNEVVKFKYPMSYQQWQHINEGNNKYGLIQYSVNQGSYEFGYIKELKYDLYGGLAEFTLKPAIL